MENVVVENIQHKIEQMQRAYAHEYEYHESDEEEDADMLEEDAPEDAGPVDDCPNLVSD